MDAAAATFREGSRENWCLSGGGSGGGGGGGGGGGVEIMQDAEERGGDRNQECEGIFMPSIPYIGGRKTVPLVSLWPSFWGRC